MILPEPLSRTVEKEYHAILFFKNTVSHATNLTLITLGKYFLSTLIQLESALKMTSETTQTYKARKTK